MKRIYIAGPYRDQRGAWYIRENMRRAEGVGTMVGELGGVPVIPHLMWALWDGRFPDEVFLAWGRSMLTACDAVCVLPHYENSSGTRGEIELAHERRIPVYYWPQDREDLRVFIGSPT